MKRNIETEMTLYCVQKPKKAKVIEAMTAELYNGMYEKFFTEKDLVPVENFTEVRYEDLIENPADVVKRIYEQLNLPNFHQTEEQLIKYIATQTAIRPHQYEIEQDLKEKIYRYLHRTIDRWDYKI
jgi:glutamate formiminotransferase